MGQLKKKSKKQKTSKVKTAVSKVKSALTGRSSSGSGKRRKKSALWYAKEIQRLKQKKKFEKEKMRL